MNLRILIFLKIFYFCHSANILGIFQIPFYSHQILVHKITRELAARGHNLTIFTTHKMNLEGLSNITQHHFAESEEIYQKYPNMMQYKREGMSDLMFYGFYQTKAYFEVVKNQIQHPEIQKLMKGDQKFDLILLECYFSPLPVLGEVFNSPIVLISLFEPFTPIHQMLSNNVNPSKYSEVILPYLHNHLSLPEKIHSWMCYLLIEITLKPFVLKLNDHLRVKYLDKANEHGSGFNKVSLLLVNTNPAFGYIRPLMPNTKQIGFAHVEAPKPLEDENLKAFMDSSDVVIICFGSTAKTSDMGEEIIQTFVKTFEEFPDLNFVWKFDEKIENLPRNVKTFKWLKLADALAHPNVKLFITHGGLNSAYEAIDREVPMIIFPLFFDQFLNARMMTFNEIGIELDLNSFSQSDLKLSIFQILNGKFKENVKSLKRIVNDQPQKPMEVAIESIEFVLRNKNFIGLKVDEPYSFTFEGFKVILVVFIIYKIVKLLRG